MDTFTRLNAPLIINIFIRIDHIQFNFPNSPELKSTNFINSTELDFIEQEKFEVEISKNLNPNSVDQKFIEIFNLVSRIKPSDYLFPESESQEIQFSNDNQFTFKNILISQNEKFLDLIDHEIIQFGKNGFKFFVDYSNSKEKSPRKIQFLREMVIPHALGRIGSLAKPINRIKLGPFSKKQIKKCNKKFIKVSDFYTKHQIGRLFMHFTIIIYHFKHRS